MAIFARSTRPTVGHDGMSDHFDFDRLVEDYFKCHYLFQKDSTISLADHFCAP
jgi:hypothetical protein